MSRDDVGRAGRFRCRVELFGLARAAAGRRDVEVELAVGATVGEALVELAMAQPGLADHVIRSDRHGLVEGHILSLNGRTFVEDAAARIEPGDVLLILSNAAGG